MNAQLDTISVSERLQIEKELKGMAYLDEKDKARLADFTRCNNCKQQVVGSMRIHKLACRPSLESLLPPVMASEWQQEMDSRYPEYAARRAAMVAQAAEVTAVATAPKEDAWEREDFHDVPYDLGHILRQAMGRQHCGY